MDQFCKWDLETLERLAFKLATSDGAECLPYIEQLATRIRTGERRGLTDTERRDVYQACDAWQVNYRGSSK